MKNIVLFILFLLTIFIINIVFYYNSEDYQRFLRSIKNGEEFSHEQKNESDTGVLENIKEKIDALKEKESDGEGVDTIITPEVDKKQEVKSNVKLGKVYQDIIDKFAQYNLEPLEIKTMLFDITAEYPDEYFEYYSRDVTLYFFPSKLYEQVSDVFKVLEGELPFTVKDTDNFGDKTFYINLDNNINDGIIRLVVSKDGIVFGLKVKTGAYPNVKKILENI